MAWIFKAKQYDTNKVLLIAIRDISNGIALALGGDFRQQAESILTDVRQKLVNRQTGEQDDSLMTNMIVREYFLRLFLSHKIVSDPRMTNLRAVDETEAGLFGNLNPEQVNLAYDGALRVLTVQYKDAWNDFIHLKAETHNNVYHSISNNPNSSNIESLVFTFLQMLEEAEGL